ncbi:hypothetical protein H257_00286 [Aphanomyces astaci]|uniref:WIBG Mago-binding domain-containing protein n=1 Tax=Aphanomyces astaci TaxID=112090 RepID=W4HCD6_APHAT|nr:hypothetical protein H257_00286 [Aphanomyces astaci]ETV88788.1 hypothetical protein H257_00286 [Aphanomyces astaci]|eukprot:XP_009821188.1 hypothetical protein H257_00286 [Aphanomyces astaci]
MLPRRLPLGAVENEDGKVVIPPSARADGSVRKEIRVRQGFVPQDEQPMYRPRALRQAAGAASTSTPPKPRAVAAPKDSDDLSACIDSLSISDEKTTMRDQTRRIPLGAVETTSGEVVIPSSARADGSVRKQIRVRPGFVPQDEQPTYRPRGLRSPSTRQDQDSVLPEHATSPAPAHDEPVSEGGIDVAVLTSPSPPHIQDVSGVDLDTTASRASSSNRRDSTTSSKQQWTRRDRRESPSQPPNVKPGPSNTPKRSPNTLRVVEL